MQQQSAITGPDPAHRREADAMAKAKERRRFKRLTTVINGRLFFAAERADGVVLDVSVNGIKFKTHGNMPLGAPVTLSLAGTVHFGGEVVWRQGNVLGVSFSKAPEQVAQIMAAMLPPDHLQSATA